MRILFLCLLLVSGAASSAVAQKITTQATTNEKARQAFKEGQAASNQREPARALEYFEKVLKADPNCIDAQLALADTYALMRDFFKSERSYEKAVAMDSSYAPVAFYFLAQVEWQLDQYDEAAQHCSSYLRSNPKAGKNRSGAEKLLASARFAAQAVKNPVPFQLKNLGPGINSKADEYFPSITADGQNLIFTRSAGGNEDFFNSARRDTTWATATPLEGVNTVLNEGAQSISPDGSWMVFTACNRQNDGSQGSCDLYWSQLKAKGWTKPAPFSATINSDSWDSQPTISADGKTIIFSSRRKGGKGGEDLWYTVRGAGGKWSKPANLGEPVNTVGVEQCPFLHPDGQTLYFCSDSLPGMGGLDLFVVRRTSDSTWGQPQNLGYPINTKANEVALNVSLDGRTAYYATNRAGGVGGMDIYSFDLPQNARPQPVTYVKALVRDARTGDPLVAKVDFSDLTTARPHLSATTKSDGSFLVCLPAGKSYSLNVNRTGYLFYSDNFNLTDDATWEKPFLLNIDLQAFDSTGATATATAKPIVLRNVFFETGSAALLPESTAELDRLRDLLNQYPKLRIRIDGHTDNVGNDAANQRLSEARAKAVQDYLLAQKIDANRLAFKGFGETVPVQSNDTPEGRSQNRRTEFVVF